MSFEKHILSMAKNLEGAHTAVPAIAGTAAIAGTKLAVPAHSSNCKFSGE